MVLGYFRGFNQTCMNNSTLMYVSPDLLRLFDSLFLHCKNAGYLQYSSIVAQHSCDLMSELDDKKCLHTTI